MGKISKSRGGGPTAPLAMIERYSVDAVRYWAASTGPGKDAIISEEIIQMPAKVVTKLWNVARFSERFLTDYVLPGEPPEAAFTPADRWMLAALQQLVRRVTQLFREFDYATAKSETEAFSWRNLTDNVLLTLLKLFAPFLPDITEETYQGLYCPEQGSSVPLASSRHLSVWPTPPPVLENHEALALGEILVDVATTIRRYKSEHNLSLGKELSRVQLALLDDAALSAALQAAIPDLMSITRARQIDVAAALDPTLLVLKTERAVQAAIVAES